MDAQAQANGAAHPGHLFNGDGVAQAVQTGTAKFFGRLDAEITQWPHLFHHLPWKAGLLIDLGSNGAELLLAK